MRFLLVLISALITGSVPAIPPTKTQFGIMIDGGSSGSRAHLFQWKTRRFNTLPPQLSVPLTSVAWTEKMKPGLSAYWQYPEAAIASLRVLMEWVKKQLVDYRQWWGYYPIYLKATAGMRELPSKPRNELIRVIRQWLRDNKTCPFYFHESEAARVISGEEEAAYAWTAINYASGALLEYSWGSGTAAPKHAYGSLEMGGASIQVAFFDPTQDILANLFKVQVGQQKHWNIYAHSFLHYGHNSGRRRMWGSLAQEKGCFNKSHKQTGCSITDKCLPSGFAYPPYLVPASSDGTAGLVPPLKYHPVRNTLIYSQKESETSWDECLEQIIQPLGISQNNEQWCMYSHRDQCSFAGVYQPSLPDADSAFGQFFLFGEYHDVWNFLNLSRTATLREFEERGRAICKLNFKQLTQYNLKIDPEEGTEHADDLPKMCFTAAYAFALLRYGYKFHLDRSFRSAGKVMYNGVKLKIGWPLGAMLYEINALPWEYDPGLQDLEQDEKVGLKYTPGMTRAGPKSSPNPPKILEEAAMLMKNFESGQIDDKNAVDRNKAKEDSSKTIAQNSEHSRLKYTNGSNQKDYVSDEYPGSPKSKKYDASVSTPTVILLFAFTVNVALVIYARRGDLLLREDEKAEEVIPSETQDVVPAGITSYKSCVLYQRSRQDGSSHVSQPCPQSTQRGYGSIVSL